MREEGKKKKKKKKNEAEAETEDGTLMQDGGEPVKMSREGKHPAHQTLGGEKESVQWTS